MNGLKNRFKAHRVASSIIIFLTLAFGILIGTVIQKGVKGKEINSSDAAQLTMPAPQQLSNAFSQVAKNIEPAVVNIHTESTIHATHRRRMPNGGDNGDNNGDDSMQDFFDRFFGGQGQGPGASPEGARQSSLGSGVIVDSKGYIITNLHVVDKADRIRVSLAGDPPTVQYDAKVIGTDAETDLAVIKIDAHKSLPTAKLGNSDSLQVGDWVLAVGSPFGLEQTVTAGIISSKGRSIDNSRQFQQFLQTDAAINPGNSGGPLVNMNSEVVGINTAIFTEGAGSQGVGFAMPSHTVIDVYNALIGPEHKVARGSIGVGFGTFANPAVERMYGVNGGEGVTVSSVNPDGPAEKAGIKVGDTIVAVNGQKVTDGNDLVNKITAEKPGTKVNIAYVRGGKQEHAAVTIEDRTKLYGDRAANDDDQSGNDSQPVSSKVGVTVRSLNSDMAQRLGVTAGKGVVVQDVKPNSFAEDIGLQKGLVILEVNRQPVNNEDDFKRITSELKSGQDVVFLVHQGRGPTGGTIFLGGTLP
jgi:serine protease Do